MPNQHIFANLRILAKNKLGNCDIHAEQKKLFAFPVFQILQQNFGLFNFHKFQTHNQRAMAKDKRVSIEVTQDKQCKLILPEKKVLKD